MPDIASPAVAIGDVERLHEVPAGKIGAGDVTHLAALGQIVERAQHFFDRRERVKSVKVIDIDIVSAEASQAGFASLNQVMT
jgi:hypothetical protein